MRRVRSPARAEIPPSPAPWRKRWACRPCIWTGCGGSPLDQPHSSGVRRPAGRGPGGGRLGDGRQLPAHPAPASGAVRRGALSGLPQAALPVPGPPRHVLARAHPPRHGRGLPRSGWTRRSSAGSGTSTAPSGPGCWTSVRLEGRGASAPQCADFLESIWSELPWLPRPSGRPRLSDRGLRSPGYSRLRPPMPGSWGPNNELDALGAHRPRAGAPRHARRGDGAAGRVRLPPSPASTSPSASAFPQLADAALLLDTEGRGEDPHRPGAGLAGDAAPPPRGAALPGDLVRYAPERAAWYRGPVPLALGASGQPGDLLLLAGQPYQGPRAYAGWPKPGRRPTPSIPPPSARPELPRSGAVDRPPGGPVRPQT